MNLLDPARCALATVRPALSMLPWAAVFDRADMLLSACRKSSFEAVFADFGQLRDGCSGTRLVRKFADRFPHTRVYLLSSHPELHRGWGRNCGAAGVLARDLSSLSHVLALEDNDPPKPHDEVSRMSSQFGSTTDVEGVRRLEQRLNEAGIGPASGVLVERAINELAGGLDNYPDLRSIAWAVSRYLPDGPDRNQFLREFEVTA